MLLDMSGKPTKLQAEDRLMMSRRTGFVKVVRADVPLKWEFHVEDSENYTRVPFLELHNFANFAQFIGEIAGLKPGEVVETQHYLYVELNARK